MKLIFHGAAQEVGRSCIELQTQGERYILDAGIKFKEGGFAYPEAVLNMGDIDGMFISHAHLDHTGALPLFEHYNIICPVFCTKLTYGLTKILLKDSFKIQRIRHLHEAYTKTDLHKLGQSVRFVKYDREYKHRDLHFMFKNAGHVPGSAMIQIEAEGKKILYTGDFKSKTTEIVKGAHQDFPDIDTMITECTYGNRQLPERQELTKHFLERIDEVTNQGGSVLIPVFSLGRAQDVLIMLAGKKFTVPIYYDGLCNKIGKRILATDDEYVNNRAVLQKMTEHGAIHVNSERRRESALSRPGIFITTSGMLQGGPVLAYLKELWGDPLNAVFLTGFQCKRTNGRHLLEEGFVYLDGWKTEVKCQVEKFDFSGHADSDDIKNLILRVHPRKLILQHGDVEDIEAIKEWAEKNTKCRVFVPHVGDTIDI